MKRALDGSWEQGPRRAEQPIRPAVTVHCSFPTIIIYAKAAFPLDSQPSGLLVHNENVDMTEDKETLQVHAGSQVTSNVHAHLWFEFMFIGSHMVCMVLGCPTSRVHRVCRVCDFVVDLPLSADNLVGGAGVV